MKKSRKLAWVVLGVVVLGAALMVGVAVDQWFHIAYRQSGFVVYVEGSTPYAAKLTWMRRKESPLAQLSEYVDLRGRLVQGKVIGVHDTTVLATIHEFHSKVYSWLPGSERITRQCGDPETITLRQGSRGPPQLDYFGEPLPGNSKTSDFDVMVVGMKR